MSAGARTAPRVERKGPRRRAEIVGVAKERLIQRGLDGLVLRDIASELGITHGNLQYYFATKNDLVKAIFDEEVEAYTTALRGAMESDSTPADLISEIVDSNLRVLGQPETRLWRILFGMADQEPYLAEILRQENETFESVLEAQLKIVAPDAPEERVRAAARIMRLVADGIGIEFIYTEPDGPSAKWRAEDVKRVLRMMLSV